VLAFAAALVLISPAAAQESYAPSKLTAQQVLAKARAARGFLQSGSYRSAWQSTGSGTTSTGEEYRQGDDYAVTIRDGDITTSYGSTSGEGWRQDPNGTVILESGYRTATDPYSVTIRAVEHGAQEDAARVLGITGTPACVVLELRPKTGLLERRYYDASTWLLRRDEETDYDGDTRVWEYSDFKTAFGYTFAQRIVYHDAHPENARVTQQTTFERASDVRSKLAIPANRPLFDMQGRTSVRIPADFTEEGIIVRVTVNGRGLDFMLDSGSSEVVLDAGVARELGLPIEDVSKGDFSGEYTEGESRLPEMSLGDLHAKNVAITAIPLQVQTPNGQRKIVGLLGGDFFGNGRIEVNFKDETVTLLPASQAPVPAPWVAVPIEIDDLVPRVHAKFNGIDGAFIVDLGAFEAMIYPHFFKQFRPNSQGFVQGQVEGIAGQGVDYREFSFSRFDFGPLSFADATAIVPSGSSFEDVDYDGVLGRNILSNFNLIFDYSQHELYVDSLLGQ
jgi:outer membrane lipoprotein-sorting protein